MDNLFDIHGKVVVITGGTGILGRCISHYLAMQGAKVAILGRKAEVGSKLAEDICNQGGEAIFLVTDVMKKEILQDKSIGNVFVIVEKNLIIHRALMLIRVIVKLIIY